MGIPRCAEAEKRLFGKVNFQNKNIYAALQELTYPLCQAPWIEKPKKKVRITEKLGVKTSCESEYLIKERVCGSFPGMKCLPAEIHRVRTKFQCYNGFNRWNYYDKIEVIKRCSCHYRI